MNYKYLMNALLSAAICIMPFAVANGGMVGGQEAPNFFNGPNSATGNPPNQEPQRIESPPVLPPNLPRPQPYNGIVPPSSVNTNTNMFVPQNNTNTNRTETPH